MTTARARALRKPKKKKKMNEIWSTGGKRRLTDR